MGIYQFNYVSLISFYVGDKCLRHLAVLDEADVVGVLAEAAAANVQIILTDEARVGSAGAAI